MAVISIICIFIIFMWVLFSFRELLEHLAKSPKNMRRHHTSFPANDPFIRDFLYKQKEEPSDHAR